jgi:membrane associated rhomboid family serine protease
MHDATEPTAWICIRRATHRRPLAEASLVLSAVAVEHRIEPHDAEWGLYVPTGAVPRANVELEKYRVENRPKQLPKPRVVIIDSGWVGVIGYLFVIWLLPTLETSFAFERNWRDAGAMQAGLVMTGQWWRTITALTLHADLGHIVANSLFGGAFGLLVGRHLGSGLGWLLVVLCGAVSNGLNAAIQPDAFRSIGASTATFAALGLVGGFVWRRGYYRGTTWRRSVAPIFAAIALFAYTGIGDENTDIVGHLTGLTTGLGCGVLAAGFDIRRIGRVGQALCGVCALLLVAVAWGYAR